MHHKPHFPQITSVFRPSHSMVRSAEERFALERMAIRGFGAMSLSCSSVCDIEKPAVSSHMPHQNFDLPQPQNGPCGAFFLVDPLGDFFVCSHLYFFFCPPKGAQTKKGVRIPAPASKFRSPGLPKRGPFRPKKESKRGAFRVLRDEKGPGRAADPVVSQK